MRRLRIESSDKIPEINIEEHDIKNQRSENAKIPKKKSRFMKNYIIDYTSNSNLHGLKYIGEKDRTFAEKVFWLLVFISCVVVCAGLIRKVWIKWNKSPVIVTFAENTTPVWQIPFPAVTVCFETRALQTKFNFTHYYHLRDDPDPSAWSNVTELERQKFEDLIMVCNGISFSDDISRNTSDGNSTVTNLIDMAPDMTETFEVCDWKGPDKLCDDLFSPILTENGICYTFNMLRAEELFRTENLHNNYQYIYHGNKSEFWSLEHGYAPKSPIETYPRRGVGYGANGALAVVMYNRKNELDYICSGAVQGSKIILHNPAELPRPTQQYFRVPLSQEVVVAIKPKVMTTSDSLEAYDPERRLCFFPTERYLRYFKVYTQANCEFECLTNYTYARCGCVHVAMPHSPEMEVCNIDSIECLTNAKSELLVVELESDLEHAHDSTDEARHVAAQCNCMPACTSIDYEAETSQDDLNWKAAFRAYKIKNDDMDHLYSRMVVFFKEPQFIKSQRSELYGQTDFLANCGGLLGLFMGFSILSLVEITYFLTLRLFSVLWTRKVNRKIKKSELPTIKHIDEKRVQVDKLKQFYID